MTCNINVLPNGPAQHTPTQCIRWTKQNLAYTNS